MTTNDHIREALAAAELAVKKAMHDNNRAMFTIGRSDFQLRRLINTTERTVRLELIRDQLQQLVREAGNDAA